MSSASKDPSATAVSATTPERARKKKRLSKEESRSSSPESKKAKSTTITSAASEVKKDDRFLFFMEENGVDKRDPEEDKQIWTNTIQEFKNITKKINVLKAGNDPDKAEQIDELRKQGLMKMCVLKKMNRLGHFRCKKARDVTLKAKQSIDHHRLQLQNLLYESMHFQREITKCLEFKSQDEDLNLVELDEFYKEAPEDIAKPDVTKTDFHQQTLARLDWELEQRKRLSEKLQSSKENKDILGKELNTIRGYLDGLQPKLNNILQATKPVQDHLGMPIEEQREQHCLAYQLPRPLFVLYRQSAAFAEACDKNLVVKVEGDTEAVTAQDSQEIQLDLDSESDNDEAQGEKDEPSTSTEERNKRHHRGSRTAKKSEDKKSKETQLNKAFKKHPLIVTFTITCEDKTVLKLTFEYLLLLKFVTVKVALTLSPDNVVPIISGDMLSPENLLSCLYPNDTGMDTPNPTNQYLLKKLGVESLEKHMSSLGYAYNWAQWLSGQDFLQKQLPTFKTPLPDDAGDRNNNPAANDLEFSASHQEETLKRLRQRVVARVSLRKQLIAFEKHSVNVNAEYQQLFPVKIISRLTQWKKCTYEDFTACPYTQRIVSLGLANPSNMFYTAVIERSSAKLTAQIMLSPEYPITAPIFSLSVKWKQECSGEEDERVRALEKEVNMHFSELMKSKSYDQLLTNQIQRLMMCFDVFLEGQSLAPSESSGPQEIAREKIFSRATRGPGRDQPYCYNSELSYFMQRST